MKSEPYQAEISTVILHTLAALDGVKINRYRRDDGGRATSVEKILNVPIKYGSKSRTVHDLVQKGKKFKYPFMSLSFNGINHAGDRNRQKDADLITKSVNPDGTYKKVHHPTPISISLELDIVSVFEEDLHQVINNFVAYFNPYVSVSWKEPFSGQELTTKVSWSGQANYISTVPLPGDKTDLYRATTSFKAESYIFREEQDAYPPIICFDMDWYSLSASQPFVDPPPQSAVGSINYCATPCINNIAPTCLSAGDTLSVYGSNMDNVDAVFLLGAASAIPGQSAFDLYQYNGVLSADYPEFTGLRVEDYNVASENRIDMTLPPGLASGGFIDIRLASLQAGYVDITDAETQPGCYYTWALSGVYLD